MKGRRALRLSAWDTGGCVNTDDTGCVIDQISSLPGSFLSLGFYKQRFTNLLMPWTACFLVIQRTGLVILVAETAEWFPEWKFRKTNVSLWPVELLSIEGEIWQITARRVLNECFLLVLTIRTLLIFPFAFKLTYFIFRNPFERCHTVTDTICNKHSWAALGLIFSGKQRKAVIAFIF